MSHTQRLRQSVIADLERVCPVTHYWLREYDPKADRELVEPLLKEPRRFGLTPREYDAANALSALAHYEICSRAIWSAAYPVRDIDSQEVETGTSEQQDTEIAARYEIFRRAALVYAKAINDPQLIEAFQPVSQINPDSAPVPKQSELEKKIRTIALKFIKDETALAKMGQKRPWQNKRTKDSPGVIAISIHVEKELKIKDERGKHDDYLSAETIRREYLKGITGRKPTGKR